VAKASRRHQLHQQGLHHLPQRSRCLCQRNFTYYTCADQTTCLANEYGGTSFAAPLWAGLIALANQQLATNGKAPVGFLDPLIYPQNLTSAYATDFHDITSGKSGSYTAVKGYDLVTGWGSPNAGLIPWLATQ
jgi:subtilase family serine protease